MKRRRTKKKSVTVPVASMGDIAFLLIIFFMVCSNFVKESAIKLEKPTAADLESVEETPVSLKISEEREIWLQGTLIQGGDPDAVEAAVRSLVADKKTDAGRTVMFQCDKNVDREVFEPIIEALAKAGARIRAVGDTAPEPKK